MGKRNKKAVKQTSRNHDAGIVAPDFGAWHPLGEEVERNKRDMTHTHKKGSKDGNVPDHNRDQRYLKTVKPRSEGQAQLIESIKEQALTFAVGPAGTGKTYLAICAAVDALKNGDVERIILSRPAVDAGESLGFLPGDLEDKMAPYLRPLYDSLSDRLGAQTVRRYIEDGTIEIAPVAYMRGRTLNNAFVVIDEAQNCTYTQLKMLLSRLGWNSTMVITGDPAQSDLLDGMSGLAPICDTLDKNPNIGVQWLEARDIVRHPLVAEILDVLK